MEYSCKIAKPMIACHSRLRIVNHIFESFERASVKCLNAEMSTIFILDLANGVRQVFNCRNVDNHKFAAPHSA